jgi:hypothetical protein
MSNSPAKARDEFALALLRVVVARLKHIELEVAAIAIALSQHLISPEEAITECETIAPGCIEAVYLSLFPQPEKVA